MKNINLIAVLEDKLNRQFDRLNIDLIKRSGWSFDDLTQENDDIVTKFMDDNFGQDWDSYDLANNFEKLYRNEVAQEFYETVASKLRENYNFKIRDLLDC